MTSASTPAPTHRATGTFDVQMIPEPPFSTADGVTLGRISINKQFHGALEGTSVGTMLSAGTPVKGSAGYVAIERVEGALDGRRGSFVLQHSGTMNRGEPQLTVTIVPDSGTGELAGISGLMTIDILDKKHLYTLNYGIAVSP